MAAFVVWLHTNATLSSACRLLSAGAMVPGGGRMWRQQRGQQKYDFCGESSTWHLPAGSFQPEPWYLALAECGRSNPDSRDMISVVQAASVVCLAGSFQPDPWYLAVAKGQKEDEPSSYLSSMFSSACVACLQGLSSQSRGIWRWRRPRALLMSRPRQQNSTPSG